MLPYLREDFGNASSLHSWGGKAMEGVERAREQVAALLGAEAPDEIVFTSGATEANNWMLRAFPEMVVSPFEHSSLFEAGRVLGHPVWSGNHPSPGSFLTGLSHEGRGIAARSPTSPTEGRGEDLGSSAFAKAQGQALKAISWMKVNNEVGTIFEPEKLGTATTIIHSDITQAVGKIPVDVSKLDYASFSGHKFYGPKGIGG